jgi:glycosyltransferase involved in cell wall biosynthesis
MDEISDSAKSVTPASFAIADKSSQPLYLPGISIVIPAHNEQNYLPETLAVLNQSLVQTAGKKALDYEIIVVNDASTDRTREIALAEGTRVVDVELRNIGAVRNAGAQVARFEWLVFVDADTVVPAETLAETILALEDGCSGGGARVDLSREAPLPWIKWLMYLAVVFFWQILGGWAAGCYMFCQRRLFDDFGGFDENFFAAEELFFSRNLKQRGKFRIIGIPVVTSARKLHGYSVWQLCRFLLLPLLRFTSPLRSRYGLEILYDDAREEIRPQ